jgi:hypothetical protein
VGLVETPLFATPAGELRHSPPTVVIRTLEATDWKEYTVGLFDRLFGADDAPQQPARNAGGGSHGGSHGGSQGNMQGSVPAGTPRSDDEIAVERYRYLLRTAPPETIEQVHTEAFSKLTPEQRDLLFRELSDRAAEGDKPASNEPRALAVSATRSELRNPGTMERSMGGGMGGGIGFGGMLASSLLGTVAGFVIGSALVSAFLPDAGATDATGAEGGDSGTDAGADSGSDAGSDAGGGFGDFGGGDFGGDFGF